MSPLVSVQWLAKSLKTGTPNLRVLDGSWHKPSSKRDAWREYQNKHIPGAVFFDIEKCRDRNNKVPLMLPSPGEFEKYAGNLGINNRTHVVVYDNNASVGLFSAPRVWWMFRVFGHDSVSVLDGGLPRWLDAGYECTHEIPKIKKQNFKAAFRPEMVKSFEDIRTNLKDGQFQIVDTRSSSCMNMTCQNTMSMLQ